jgi:poly-gamma-glutamate capsule biosynthesis protein CapA/YwtB (metallophosphatase superfamily)
MGVRGTAAAAALLALVSTACTSSSSPEAGPGSSPAVTPSLPAAPDTVVDLDQPLVLAVNPRLPPIEVSLRVARRVVRGEVTDWSTLGRPAGQLTLTRRVRALASLAPGTLAVVPASAVGPEVRAVDVGGVDPLREPSRYPLRTDARQLAPEPTTLTVVGDVMLGRRVGERAAAEGDPAYALRPMQRRLSSADLTVGNFESTLSRDGEPTQGPDSFSADPRVRAGLRAAGFDALGVANNHLGDFGDRALVQTVHRLRAGGLRPFGAGATPDEARRPVVVSRHGVRFGFLAFNAIGETPEVGPGQPGAVSVGMPPRTGPLDRVELARVLDAVRRLDGRVDVVTVMPHWGEQYTQRPWPAQRRVAGALVRAGADLVVGGHPHWVQGASMRGDALVVHSLGNFVFDMDGDETQEGLVLETVFWGDQLKAAEFVPYRIGEDHAPRVVSWDRAAANLDLFWEFSGLGASR